MDVSEFLEGIGCTEYRDVFDSFDADEEKRLFFSDFSRFVENGRKKADPEFYFLSIFLHLGFDCHEIYKERSIPDSIYFATFHDISIWARWFSARRRASCPTGACSKSGMVRRACRSTSNPGS